MKRKVGKRDRGGGGAAIDAGRERKRRRRRRMAWQVQTHSEHNVSAGSNKRHQAHLSPPLSRFIPPPTPSLFLVQLLLACPSVSLPVRPFLSVVLSFGLSFSLLSPPSTLSSPFAFSCHPREPLLSRIYIPVLMCPLSAVLVLASSSTSLFSFPLSPPLSSNLSLSVSSHFLLFFFLPSSLFISPRL